MKKQFEEPAVERVELVVEPITGGEAGQELNPSMGLTLPDTGWQ